MVLLALHALGLLACICKLAPSRLCGLVWYIEDPFDDKIENGDNSDTHVNEEAEESKRHSGCWSSSDSDCAVVCNIISEKVDLNMGMCGRTR